MIAGREVDDAKHLRLQCSDPVDYLLDVWDGPAFQCPSGRVESYVVEGEAPLLGCAFRCGASGLDGPGSIPSLATP